MKKAYLEPKKWQKKTQDFVDKIVSICNEYQALGYKLTLRTLFYQLVTKGIIQNVKKEYARLSKVLTDARMAGIVDWDIIEDRIRVLQKHAEFNDIPDLVDVAVHSYRRPRWENQDNYCEVWLEKDALSGILLPITNEYHVPLLVDRGFSSTSAVHDAAIRLMEQEKLGKKCTILYLGDHDPSGLSMPQDIEKRFRTFGCYATINMIALTMEQIRKYKPPRNIAKTDDSRADKYIKLHGEYSWELDVLTPEVLSKLLRSEIEKVIDMEKYDAIKALEQEEIKSLRELIERI